MLHFTILVKYQKSLNLLTMIGHGEKRVIQERNENCLTYCLDDFTPNFTSMFTFC